ncbi:hypothetical protein [uncultured Chryseobacterium sp.]|uniref:hypothetical protein n=1 Tax=uncultured Chryseobacterium sp. TaxID=259322 RepID=UPI0025ED0A73|nr:hypothetical protein [uncultured Chryseobacterium sp.]
MLDNVPNWLIENIEQHDQVLSVNVEIDNVITIQRKEGISLRVAAISSKVTILSMVVDVVNAHSFDFLLNIPKNAYTVGEVFEFLDLRKISYGGLGDLYRVISEDDNWPYQPKEVSFIMRGLEQHFKVLSVKRLDDRRYSITRKNLPMVIILALNDYDFNTETIRNGKQIYKTFDGILASNPNVRITGGAESIAKSLGVKIYTWGKLLGALNNIWKKS